MKTLEVLYNNNDLASHTFQGLSMTDYTIRQATPGDLDIILHHRRRMFEDIGSGTPATLDVMIASSTPLLRKGLEVGTYHGWLVEAPGEGVVSGGGIISLEFQPSPVTGGADWHAGL